MKLFDVDLYEYFARERKGNAGGRLTCYLHENSVEIAKDRRYPAMLVLPGGGYVYCSDREAEPIAEYYYARGFNAYILRYSCVPSRYPAQLDEAAMAVAYIKRNAALHLGTGKVAAIGFSAGGHLCGNLATVTKNEADASGFALDEIRPDAAVLSYAVISPSFAGDTFPNLVGGDVTASPFAEKARSLSVDGRISPTTPPLFIWHTANDAGVNSEQAMLVARAAKINGVKFELHVFSCGQHGLSVADERVYPKDSIPKMSAYAGMWADMSAAFLAECGLTVEDN